MYFIDIKCEKKIIYFFRYFFVSFNTVKAVLTIYFQKISHFSRSIRIIFDNSFKSKSIFKILGVDLTRINQKIIKFLKNKKKKFKFFITGKLKPKVFHCK